MEPNYQKARYGGFNWSGAFFGWLVAMAVATLLSGLIGTIGGNAILNNPANLSNLRAVGITSAIALLVAWAVAYYAGGYVAGRMARFDGGRQGLGVWVMGIIITLIVTLAAALFGTTFNLLRLISVPHIPINGGAITFGGLFYLLVALAVSAFAAMAGARVGVRYHERVDEAGMVGADTTTRRAEQPPARRASPSFGEKIEKRPPDER